MLPQRARPGLSTFAGLSYGQSEAGQSAVSQIAAFWCVSLTRSANARTAITPKIVTTARIVKDDIPHSFNNRREGTQISLGLIKLRSGQVQ
jgi:hypothetical protein